MVEGLHGVHGLPEVACEFVCVCMLGESSPQLESLFQQESEEFLPCPSCVDSGIL